MAGAAETVPDGPSPQPVRCRIGVARDAAFCFYYQDNLDLLQAHGAEVIPFGPLDDGGLPEDLDGLYLGGGYPEMFADRLAANGPMRQAVRAFAASGRPIYAECGGFMYLTEEIRDLDGKAHPMVGIFPTRVRCQESRLTLGYASVRLVRDCPLGRAGDEGRGHVFHLSEVEPLPPDLPRAYAVAGGPGQGTMADGYLVGSVLGSYVHLHFGSNPALARNLVAACAAARGRR